MSNTKKTVQAVAIATIAATGTLAAAPAAWANEVPSASGQEGEGSHLEQEASENTVNAPQNKQEAQENLEKAEDETRQACQDAHAAKKEVFNAEDKVAEVQEELDAVQNDLNEADEQANKAFEEAKQDAANAVSDSQVKYEKSLAEKKAADAASQEAQENADIAQQAEESAKQELISTIRDMDPGYDADASQSQLETARQDVDAAEKTLNEAVSALEDAQNNGEQYPEVVAAKKAVEDAAKTLDEAGKQVDSADAAVSEAEQKKETADKAQNEAANEVSAAESASVAAQRELDAASAEQNLAKTALDTAKSLEQAANTRYSTAQQELANAESAVTSKTNDKLSFDLAAKNAEDALSAAQTALQDAESQNAAQESSLKNSRQFFEAEGSSNAVLALDDAKYKDFTDTSSANDATSIENMKKAFQFLRECNAIRESLGLQELLVTDTLMAIAQSNLNWSDENIDHSRQFGVTENLSWGNLMEPYAFDWDSVVKSSNPFEAWFDCERKMYLEALAQNPEIANMTPTQMRAIPWNDEYGNASNLYSCVGHYLSIVNPDFRYTGFAVSTDPSNPYYGRAYGQVFAYGDNTQYPGYVGSAPGNYNRPGVFEEFQGRLTPETAYTVDEYEARLLAAIAASTPAPTDLTRLQKAVADAETTYENAKALASAAQGVLEQSEAVRDAKLDAVAQAAEEKQNVERAVLAAQARYDAAQDKTAEKDGLLRTAEPQVASAKTALTSAQQASTQAAAALETAKANASAAQAALNKARTDYDEALATYADALPNFRSLEAAVKDAKKQYEAKEKIYSQLKSDLDEKARLNGLVNDALSELGVENQRNSKTLFAATRKSISAIEMLAQENPDVQKALASYTEAISRAEEALAAAQASHIAANDKQQLFLEAEEELSAAEEELAKVSSFVYQGANTPKIEDESYDYLNELVNKTRDAEAEVARVREELTNAQAALNAAHVRYESAHQRYVDALAVRAVAQMQYDKLLEENNQKNTTPQFEMQTPPTIPSQLGQDTNLQAGSTIEMRGNTGQERNDENGKPSTSLVSNPESGVLTNNTSLDEQSAVVGFDTRGTTAAVNRPAPAYKHEEETVDSEPAMLPETGSDSIAGQNGIPQLGDKPFTMPLTGSLAVVSALLAATVLRKLKGER